MNFYTIGITCPKTKEKIVIMKDSISHVFSKEDKEDKEFKVYVVIDGNPTLVSTHDSKASCSRLINSIQNDLEDTEK